MSDDRLTTDADRIGDWMITHSGRQFYPYDPHPDDFEWMDIVVGLREPRFACQTTSVYTVAQHSVMVSLIVPPKYAWRALLHDAPEALLKDIPRPIKKGGSLRGYTAMEDALWSCICVKWDLPYQDEIADRFIKKADRIALVTERASLQKAAWERSGKKPWREDDMGVEPLDIELNALPPYEACKLFHYRMLELRKDKRTQLVPSLKNSPWPWRPIDPPGDLWFHGEP